ncbi:hypothetical protein HYU22_00010 [Candidatus Woesearchaeota archaeon]|nr:hypothetical protein [Candidatus Woesearchaeota archaeon]
MTQLEEQIAIRFLDDILTKQHIEKEKFYGLLNSLGQVPYLAKVRPQMHLEDIYRGFRGEIGLHISATYTGDKRIGCARKSTFEAVARPEIQQQVEELYADLAAKTGFMFNAPLPDLSYECCTARVSMGEPAAGSTKRTELHVILYRQKK